MNPQVSQLASLRDAIASYLGGLETFAGVNVVTRQGADLINTLTNNLAETGVVAEVAIKNAHPSQGQSFTVKFEPVVLSVTIYENVLVNQDPATGTGKGAFWLVESALVALKMWTPPGFSNVVMPDTAGPQYGQEARLPGALILAQDFTTTLQLDKRPA